MVVLPNIGHSSILALIPHPVTGITMLGKIQEKKKKNRRIVRWTIRREVRSAYRHGAGKKPLGCATCIIITCDDTNRENEHHINRKKSSTVIADSHA